ncbi:MAG: HlyD family efflux transporter periplasmic adaptor subunit [Acidobacteria bacterium]|nr:HlyD family efflux transporter periplasmic adaptor subunit [Acidobacteriota bacterium]
MSEPNPNSLHSPVYLSGSALPSLPLPQPSGSPAGPQAVAPKDDPPKRSFAGLWIALVACVAAGAGYWMWQSRSEAAKTASFVTIRTATAASAPMEKTLRLTGATAAEKYVSLIAPSMRGGRGGGSSMMMMGGSRGGGMMVVSMSSGGGGDRGGSGGSRGGSSGGGGGSTSSGGQSTLAATSMSGGNMVASTSGAGAGGGGGGSSVSGDTVSSSAGAGSSNLRTGGSGRAARPTTTRAATTSRGRSTTSASTGADGLGSTASQIPGGGGGSSGGSRGGGPGGGGSPGGDFMMQLQTLAPNGVRVEKGATVAEFDRQYMLLRLDDYRATVEQSESSMKAAIANLEVTRKSYEQQILAARNAVSKAELDMKTTPVRGAIDSERLKLALEETKANLKQLNEAAKYVDIGEKATLKVSDLELQTSKVEYRRAEANADKMIIKAPMDGLVVMQNTFRGGEFGLIQQGDQVFPGQMFMQIVDQNSMVVNATVNQVDVQSMRLGQRAKVRFDAFPGLELKARVVMIGAITKSAGTRAAFKKDIPVRLKLEQMDPRVIPDLSVSADVVLDETTEAAAVVPAEALQTGGGEAGAKPFVHVRNAAGVWERRIVEVAVVSYTHAAIRSGLKPGEVVALEPPPQPGGNEQTASSNT